MSPNLSKMNSLKLKDLFFSLNTSFYISCFFVHKCLQLNEENIMPAALTKSYLLTDYCDQKQKQSLLLFNL